MITCIFEDGGKGSKRHVTVDGIIVKDNKILLVKRGDNVTNPNKYALPGGFLDRDETLKEGVKREVQEETGYKAKDATLFRIIDNPKRKGEDRQNVNFVFIVEVGEKISSPDKENKEVLWIDLDSLPGEKDFAFDHFECIEKYREFEKVKQELPG
jgi:8-oxo-dGTP diphosphatase